MNETIKRVFTNIEESAKGTASEPDLKGLFSDFDVNSNKLGAEIARIVNRQNKLRTQLDNIIKVGSINSVSEPHRGQNPV